MMVSYLYRLVQRLSPQVSRNMLLPNSDAWGSVIDPFENTRYVSPVYPDSSKRQATSRAEVSPPFSISPGEQSPIAAPNVSNENSPLVSEEKYDKSLKPEKYVEAVVPSTKPQETNSISTTENNQAATEKNSSTQPTQDTGTRMMPEFQQNSLQPRRRPQTPQWKTLWVRRYSSDFTSSAGEQKIKSMYEGVLEPQIRWLPPRNEQAPFSNENAPIHNGNRISSLVGRRALKQAQSEKPRLVIGQLTVDVVPEKPVRHTNPRKKTLKNRVKDRQGKLNQSEVAKFGFGIGQM